MNVNNGTKSNSTTKKKIGKSKRHKVDPDTGYTKRQQKAEWKRLFGLTKS